MSRWRRYLVHVQRWIVLDADRWLVTAVLSLGTFLTIVALGTFGPATPQEFLTAGIALGSVLVELLKVIVSVVVIVLPINQLVLSPGLGSALDDLIELFMVTREYLKTVYIRSEYIELSRRLLYLGLPAAVLTYGAAQLYLPEIFPGALLGFDRQLLFVAGAVTVGLSPFVLLIAYVLRLAAMSRSTLFVGPFVARSGEEIRREEA